MKVILKQDVAKIGKKYDIAEVPNGYALNTLIPQGKVQPATQENKNAIEQIKKRAQFDVQADIEIAENIVTSFTNSALEVPMEVNEKGQLFQALAPSHIIASAQAKGVEIPLKMLEIPETIKELGNYTVSLVAGKEKYPLEITVVAK